MPATRDYFKTYSAVVPGVMVCGPSFGASLRLAVYSLNGIVTAAVCAVAVSVLLPDSLLGLGIGLGLTMLVGTYIQGSAPNTQFRLFWSQAELRVRCAALNVRT